MLDESVEVGEIDHHEGGECVYECRARHHSDEECRMFNLVRFPSNDEWAGITFKRNHAASVTRMDDTNKQTASA